MNGARTLMVIEKVWWVMAVFGSIFVNIIIMIYFQLNKLAAMEELLSDVKLVQWNKSVWGGGLIGRQMRLNGLAMIIIMHKLMKSRGEIPPDADKRLSSALRLQLQALYLFSYANGAALAWVYFSLD
jgi:hypothetical protein